MRRTPGVSGGRPSQAEETARQQVRRPGLRIYVGFLVTVKETIMTGARG